MRRILSALGPALVVLAGCSSLSVNVDYDKEVDFQGYRTYAWAERDVPDVRVLGRGPLAPLPPRLSARSAGEIYNLLALARHEDRFVLPTRGAGTEDIYATQGCCGFSDTD